MSRAGAVRIACPAKVNLFLEVLSRREDGYHEIVTVLQTIGLFDTIEVRPEETGLSLEVAGADLPDGPGNLAYDAGALFLSGFAPDRGARVILTKRIPARAGLGGGSSDAAGTLLALARILRPDLSPEDLLPLAGRLGSDVPFFLRGGTALARGRGEALTAMPPNPPRWLVLFLPPFGLSTPDVYRQVRVPAEAERREPGGGLFNRLEEAATRVDPRVAEVRSALGAHLREEEPLLMSGSGSAFFAPVSGPGRAGEVAAGVNRSGGIRALAVRTVSA